MSNDNEPRTAEQSQIREVLRTVFGFSSFRAGQGELVEALVAGQNALVLMPTGIGKSLCYQLPARIFSEAGKGITLVVSPLIALMKDQVDAAQRKGLRVAFINSSLRADEREARYRALFAGRYELLYVTPERFRVPEFRAALAQNRIALLAIDEAHCISAWGHDFRPDYSRLGDIRRDILGNPQTVALTATATPAVQEDILKQLGLANGSNTAIFNRGIQRPNLAIEVVDVHGLDQKIQGFMAFRHMHPGSSILYFALVQTLEKFSHEIGKLGIEHFVYHGQLGDRERRRAQEGFLSSPHALVLATPAFGLGIDKENVRMVMHAEVPGSLEAYYQEIGRAGRDGGASACVLLFDDDDVTIQRDFTEWANPDPGFIVAVYNLIERNLLRARQEGFGFLRRQMNFFNSRDFRVETAVNLLERWGALEGRSPREWTPIQSPPEEFLDQKLFALRLSGQRAKLTQMVDFVKMTEGCRMLRIAAHFGFPAQAPCQVCDLCLKRIQGGHS